MGGHTQADQVVRNEAVEDTAQELLVAQAEGRFIRQTGGHGQYGVVTLTVEPLARGEGFVRMTTAASDEEVEAGFRKIVEWAEKQ